MTVKNLLNINFILMNDRFKFRAWAKGLGMMWTWSDLKDLPLRDLEREDLIWLQSTGFNDKNGKLMFEGDIVKVMFRMNVDDGASIYLEVIEDIRELPKLGGSSRTFEIIGNIHENPELLSPVGEETLNCGICGGIGNHTCMTG